MIDFILMAFIAEDLWNWEDEDMLAVDMEYYDND
jgi:hypothetical protein